MEPITPEMLGAKIAQVKFKDWPTRLKLFREQLKLEKNKEAQNRTFEIEAAIYISHEEVFSFALANQKIGFSEAELKQICEGFLQVVREFLATHGWKTEDFRKWEEIHDERFCEYLDLTNDLLAGGKECGPSLKLGHAFIKHALPKLKSSNAEMLFLCDAINFHALHYIAASVKAIQGIMANGGKTFWQRLLAGFLNAPVDD